MCFGSGVALHPCYQSIAKSAGKDFGDGADVPFKCMWMLLGY